jgi:hypothetical protein
VISGKGYPAVITKWHLIVGLEHRLQFSTTKNGVVFMPLFLKLTCWLAVSMQSNNLSKQRHALFKKKTSCNCRTLLYKKLLFMVSIFLLKKIKPV